MLLDVEKLKNEFVTVFNERIKRDGAQDILSFLYTSDFFKAPASTKFHGNTEGGLVNHSLNVYKTLCNLNEKLELGFDEESMAIVALLHDICKTNYYKIEYRNKKNEQTNLWEKIPYYPTDEQFIFGHSEKSCYMIQSMMRLQRDEAYAIRAHMGAWDKDPSIPSAIFEKSKLALYLHISDMISSKTLEETY